METQTTLNGKTTSTTTMTGCVAIPYYLFGNRGMIEQGKVILPRKRRTAKQFNKEIVSMIFKDYEVIDLQNNNCQGGIGTPDFKIRNQVGTRMIEVKNVTTGDGLKWQQFCKLMNGSEVLWINGLCDIVGEGEYNYERVLGKFYQDFNEKGLSRVEVKNIFRDLHENTIDRIFIRLENRGHITLCAKEVGPTKSRRYYKITEEGENAWERRDTN